MTPQELSNKLYATTDASQCREILQSTTPEEYATVLLAHFAGPDFNDCFFSTASSLELLPIFRAFIDAGADVNHRRDGNSVLDEALGAGNIEAARLLVERGAKILTANVWHEDTDTMDRSTIDAAMGYAGLHSVDFLLDNGVDAGAILVDAAKRSRTDIVRHLLDRGVEVDARASDGSTALISAIYYYSGNPDPTRQTIDIVRMLLDAGADIEARDKFGNTPLLTAAFSAGNSTAIMDELLRRGADINARHQSGQTSLMMAVVFEYDQAVRVLIDAGADVDIPDTSGETPLNYARRSKFNGIAQILVEAGAVEVPPHAESSLHLAILHNREAAALRLIAEGGDIEELGPENLTPLMAAATYWGKASICRALVEAGADINRVTRQPEPDDDQYAMAFAAAAGRADIVRLLLENGASIEPDGVEVGTLLRIIWGFRYSRKDPTEADCETLRLLIAAGMNIDIRFGTCRFAPLHIAASTGNVEYTRIFLDAGAYVSATTFPSFDYSDNVLGGWTPLLTALVSSAKSPEIVKLLIDYGADVNIVDERGRTPLDYVGWNIDEVNVDTIVAIYKVLVDAGADVNSVDEFGATSLDHAIRNNMPAAVIELLRSEGAIRGSGVSATVAPASSCGAILRKA